MNKHLENITRENLFEWQDDESNVMVFASSANGKRSLSIGVNAKGHYVVRNGSHVQTFWHNADVAIKAYNRLFEDSNVT